MTMHFDANKEPPSSPRRRKPGGGRKPKPITLEHVTRLIDEIIPSTKNNILQWTTKSLRELTGDIRTAGCDVNRNVVSKGLQQLGFRLNRNRELPRALRPSDIDCQYEIIDKTVSMRLESNNPIILLTVDRADLPRRGIQTETSFEPPDNIAAIDENEKYERVFIPCPPPFSQETRGEERLLGQAPSGIWCDGSRPLSPEEKQEIKRQKREATKLDLDMLTTERHGALFIAAVLEHWWSNLRKSLFCDSDSLLLLTHGGSPDCIDVLTWRWAMDRLARKLGISIAIGRLPPAIWRFKVISSPLFSFTWLRFKNTDKEGFAFEEKNIKGAFSVKACLLGKSLCECEEVDAHQLKLVATPG